MAVDSPGFGLPPGFGQAVSAVLGGIFDKDQPSAIDQVKSSPAWNDPDELYRLRDRAENAPARRDDRARQQFIRGLDRRIDELDVETFEGVSDSPSSIVGDQELSPVFGGTAGVAALGIGMSDAMRKALEKQIGALEKRLKIKTPTTTRMVVTNKQGIPVKATIPKSLESRIGNIAIKSAQRAMGPVTKVSKRLPKAGGPAGTVAVLGAQFGLDKVVQVVADRQFAQMEKILRKQQADTNKAVRKIRAEQKKAGLAPPPGKPPGGATGSPRPAATPARARAPSGAPSLEPIRPKLPAKKPEILGPGTPLTTAKIGGPSLLARVVEFAKIAAPLAGLANIGANNKQSFSAAVPTSSRQSQSSPSSFFSARPSSSSGLCECKPKRTANRTKKRRKPRVCVSKSVAARAGIAA